MAYIFLEQEDFEASILKQLLTERNSEENDVIAILEQKEAIAVEMVKSKLSGRFDTDAIFGTEGIERHYLIIHFVVTIAIYLFVKRNAARKVPSDYKEGYEEVMKTLEKIQAGKEVPPGLPKPTDGNGDVVVKPIIANRKNTDYYI
ncbi:phage protein Gp36 family protein [Allomuricauda sp. M10]|uniref:phage protein Gp36 family protein n=1 Tax=Allomuricauda sp. M10 TaxID=2683292 RepID=UPI001D19882B|nr:phage protein Gp36 family protein [Muricauda sp. M10]